MKNSVKLGGEYEINEKMTRLMVLLLVCLLGVVNTSTVYAAYDGDKAVEYADKYWNSNNGSYPSYSNDCTNFASQCVLAGGIKKVALPASKIKLTSFGSTYTCTDYWSCNYYTYKIVGITVKKGYIPTSSWTLVDNDTSKSLADSIIYGFQDFIKEKKNKTVTTYSCASDTEMEKLIKNAEVGDIVQIRRKGDTRFSHTYIVGKKKKNSDKKKDIFFYAHTGSRGAEEKDSLRNLRGDGTIPNTATLALISM